MTDLHTHILPAMDDGAKTAEESLTLLRMEWEQGVDTVVLTPHFYREKEDPAHFLQRRQKAAELLEERICQLPEEERSALPRRLLGVEVAWKPNLPDWEELPQLCIGETDNLLLELPFTPWNDRMIGRIYDLINRTGITPVIAHLERYLGIQSKKHLDEILQLGVPVQVSGDALARFATRGPAMKLLKTHRAHLLASDCHNPVTRPPSMKSAMDMVQKKLGEERVQDLIYYADELAGI